MVRGMFKSRSLRRVKKVVPGNTVKIHYLPRKPQPAHCTGCGVALQGILCARPKVMQKAAKTKKRPERPYGGTLCTQCMRKKMIDKARKLS